MRYPGWSRDKAQLAGQAFLSTRQRLPVADDLTNACGLPSYTTVQKLFGSLPAYHDALCPQPEQPRRPLGQGERRCMRCDNPFTVAYPGHYTCTACKNDPTRLEIDEEWMNGPTRW